VSKVPCKIAIVAEVLVEKALPNVQPPPTPLNVIDPVEKAPVIAVPLVVIVFPVVVALNVTGPVALQTVPAISDIEPLMANVGDVPVANVTVPADTVISRQVNAPVQVTVYVPAWSKNTESAAVGTDAPLGPPDEVDQFVVDEVFHVPAPPTQYLSMLTPELE
jgi:hypothetical protein